MKLVLGSASPRRKALLIDAGFVFDLCVPDIAEQRQTSEAPRDYALRNCSEKSAKALSLWSESECCVLCADTIVVQGSHVLEKPQGAADARRMLTELSGRSHEVITGVSIRSKTRHETFATLTEVHFKKLTSAEIERYLATGEPFDKAGAYGIQGKAAFMVQRIVGSYTNVVGLPLAEVCELLKSFEIQPR